MNDIKYEIKEHIATLSTSASNWTKELNLISWSGKQPVYDIRSWNETHERMSKGITLTSEEIEILKGVICNESA